MGPPSQHFTGVGVLLYAACRPLPRCTAAVYCPPVPCRRMYSELISAAIATGGPHASKTSAVKLMRRWVLVAVLPGTTRYLSLLLCFLVFTACTFAKVHICLTSAAVPTPARSAPAPACSVKKVTLRLIETLVDKCEDPDLVAAQVWGSCRAAAAGRAGTCCVSRPCLPGRRAES